MDLHLLQSNANANNENMKKYQKNLGYTIGDDGIFFIELNDFLDRFEKIYWVEVYPEYLISHIDIPMNKIEFRFPISGVFTFVLTVEVKRIIKNLSLYIFIDLPDAKLYRDCEINTL